MSGKREMSESKKNLIGSLIEMYNIEDMKFPLPSNGVDIKVFEVNKIKRLVESTKRNNSVNMRIPFEVSAKSMNNSNKPVMNDIRESKKIFGRFRNMFKSLFLFIRMLKLIFKNEINSRRKFIQESSIIKKELTTLFRDSKKNMSMMTVDDILRNIFSPSRRIFKPTRGTKSRFT